MSCDRGTRWAGLGASGRRRPGSLALRILGGFVLICGCLETALEAEGQEGQESVTCYIPAAEKPKSTLWVEKEQSVGPTLVECLSKGSKCKVRFGFEAGDDAGAAIICIDGSSRRSCRSIDELEDSMGNLSFAFDRTEFVEERLYALYACGSKTGPAVAWSQPFKFNLSAGSAGQDGKRQEEAQKLARELVVRVGSDGRNSHGVIWDREMRVIATERALRAMDSVQGVLSVYYSTHKSGVRYSRRSAAGSKERRVEQRDQPSGTTETGPFVMFEPIDQAAQQSGPASVERERQRREDEGILSLEMVVSDGSRFTRRVYLEEELGQQRVQALGGCDPRYSGVPLIRSGDGQIVAILVCNGKGGPADAWVWPLEAVERVLSKEGAR